MWCTTRFYLGTVSVLVVYQRLTRVSLKYKASINFGLENRRNWLIAKTLVDWISSNVSSCHVANILIEDEQIQRVNKSKALGITIDQHLFLKSNTKNICKKNVSGISALRRVKLFIAEIDTYNAITHP